MNKLLSLVFLFLISLLFWACPYESMVPIDNPSNLVNSKLMGTWEDRETMDTFKITKHDKFRYHIDQTNKEDQKSKYYLAHLSKVSGKEFINLKHFPDTAIKTYTFYKLEFKKGDSLLLSEITENIEERFSTSTKLKKFIAQNMENSYFFGKNKITMHRIGK